MRSPLNSYNVYCLTAFNALNTANRHDQELSAAVYKLSNKSGTLRTVEGKSDGQSLVLDIDETDVMYVGGIPQNFKVTIAC